MILWHITFYKYLTHIITILHYIKLYNHDVYTYFDLNLNLKFCFKITTTKLSNYQQYRCS